VRCEKKSVSCPCRENAKDWFAGGKEEVFFFVENSLSLRTITKPRRRRGKKAGGKGRKESLSFLQVFVILLLCLDFSLFLLLFFSMPMTRSKSVSI